ncbi:hypothetical protein L1049_013504 [Liquidambar formosana]|uniref:Uncharacterized protein n=1 Tax=Liquidambar formosana TaxID=63359 RepID=A0AAP0RKM3_LIQFO
MESEGSDKDMVVTQISFGGFDSYVTAKELTEYLEDTIGLVWRCRLKTSSTPPESFPNFEINIDEIQRTDDYKKVEPHAFAHFVSPESVNCAVDAAGRGELFLNNQHLKVSLGPENPFRINQRRRTTTPFSFKDVCVEIGVLVSRAEFFVGWKGPATGVDFLVDPFDGTCKFLFTKDTAFSFKGKVKHAVIKCDFKMEFMVRDINEVSEYKDMSSLIVLLQLASSPLNLLQNS